MDGFECGLEEAFGLLVDVFWINAGYTQHLNFTFSRRKTMTELMINGSTTGVSLEHAHKQLQELADSIQRIMAGHNGHVLDIDLTDASKVDGKYKDLVLGLNDGRITPDADPDDFPPELLPYIKAASFHLKNN